MTDDSSTLASTRKIVLLVTTLPSFLTPFMMSAINVALPQIGDDFHMDAIALSWVVTVFILASVVILVPVGRLADIYGRKRFFGYGMIVFTAASFLLTITPSANMLIAFRVLQGIGGAMTFSTAVAMLMSVYPAQERGRVLGINVAVVYLGLSLGPFLGGVLTHYFGWRSIFLSNALLGLPVIVAVFWKIKGEWAEAKGEKFDFAGSVIYSLVLVAIMYGFTLLPQLLGGLLILAGVLGIGAFIWWETRVESPVLHVALFRHNTVFALSNLATLISYGATTAVAFLLSLYLQYIKGLNPQDAGLVLVAAPAMQAIFSPLAGRFSDKIEPRIIASVGMGLTSVGLLMLILLNGQTSLLFIVISLIILGFGFGLFASPNINAVMSSVHMKFYGVASATIATMRQVGMVFSMGLSMLLFSIFIGKVQITPEYYTSFLTSVRVAFIVFTVLGIGGIFASLARGKIKHNSVPYRRRGL